MQRMLFVQYIMALAMVKAVRAELHARFPIYIKWPNDVYVDMSGHMDDERGSESISDMRFRFVDKLKRGCMTKIGGILVNSSFGSGGMDMGTCTLVVGCGLNANNDAPTVALKHLATKLQLDTSALTMERLLARVSVEFSNVYGRLLAGGFDACADEYYRYWIHQNQPVLIRDDCETSLNHRGIEDEKDGAKTTRARITGVTAEGNLRAVDADGCVIELMPGGNSFQLAEGMISRRIA